MFLVNSRTTLSLITYICRVHSKQLSHSPLSYLCRSTVRFSLFSCSLSHQFIFYNFILGTVSLLLNLMILEDCLLLSFVTQASILFRIYLFLSFYILLPYNLYIYFYGTPYQRYGGYIYIIIFIIM